MMSKSISYQATFVFPLIFLEKPMNNNIITSLSISLSISLPLSSLLLHLSLLPNLLLCILVITTVFVKYQNTSEMYCPLKLFWCSLPLCYLDKLQEFVFKHFIILNREMLQFPVTFITLPLQTFGNRQKRFWWLLSINE